MDLYSRCILGWHVSPSLAADGALCCLQMAIQELPAGTPGPIHHSDHGVQYTSQAYLDCLQEHGLRASMGAVGNCYDNIYAERLINTLKNEYRLGDRFVDQQQVQQLVEETVYLYNTDRPHLALQQAVPQAVYAGQVLNVKEITIKAAV